MWGEGQELSGSHSFESSERVGQNTWLTQNTEAFGVRCVKFAMFVRKLPGESSRRQLV